MKNALVVTLVLLVAEVCRAELALQRVSPEKIYCKPGETVALEVVVANAGNEAASARLVVELIHDLDTPLPLAAVPVTVEPGKTALWQGKWQAREWLGVELRARLLRGAARSPGGATISPALPASIRC